MGPISEEEQERDIARQKACKHDYRADIFDHAAVIVCIKCFKYLRAYYFTTVTKEQIKEWNS